VSLSAWVAQPYMASCGAAKAYLMALGEALHQVMVFLMTPGALPGAVGSLFKKMMGRALGLGAPASAHP
jgi:short-subunit dehydrogenase